MAPTAHAATARARTILGLSLAAALAAVHVSGDVVGYSEVLASAKYSESPTAVVEFLSPGEHPAIHLHYLPLRAAGDLIALMLEEGQMPYMATYHGKRRFHGKIKSEMPLGRVPVLEHHGLMLHQSSAIVRYLAPFVALDGGHDHEKALVDAMYETVQELFGGHNTIKFSGKALREGNERGYDASNHHLRFKDLTNRGIYTAFEQSMAILLTFEDYLTETNAGYLVGPTLTYADLALWLKLERLEEVDDENSFLGWAPQLGLPMLHGFMLEIGSRPAVADYVHSERRMPRFERCEKDYCYKPDQHHPPPQAAHSDEL